MNRLQIEKKRSVANESRAIYYIRMVTAIQLNSVQIHEFELVFFSVECEREWQIYVYCMDGFVFTTLQYAQILAFGYSSDTHTLHIPILYEARLLRVLM